MAKKKTPQTPADRGLDRTKLMDSDDTGGEWEATEDLNKDEPDLVAARIDRGMDDESVVSWLEESGLADELADEDGEVKITDALRKRYLHETIESLLYDWPDRGDSVLVLTTNEEMNERGDVRLRVSQVGSVDEELYCYVRDRKHLEKIVLAEGWFLSPPTKKEIDKLMKGWKGP